MRASTSLGSVLGSSDDEILSVGVPNEEPGFGNAQMPQGLSSSKFFTA